MRLGYVPHHQKDIQFIILPTHWILLCFSFLAENELNYAVIVLLSINCMYMHHSCTTGEHSNAHRQ